MNLSRNIQTRLVLSWRLFPQGGIPRPFYQYHLIYESYMDSKLGNHLPDNYNQDDIAE